MFYMAGKLIVHGLDQSVVGGTLSVLIDGSKVADVKMMDSVTIPITHACTMSIKCGINLWRFRTIWSQRCDALIIGSKAISH